METGLSDKIRDLAKTRYVHPAIHAGKREFFIRVRDILGDLQAEGFPGGHTPQVCSALRTSKFLRENGLEIESIEGPPSKMSPTVVVNYRISREDARALASRTRYNKVAAPQAESPAERALRLTEKLRGKLKEELAEYGGAEGFMRWIRSEDEDAA